MFLCLRSASFLCPCSTGLFRLCLSLPAPLRADLPLSQQVGGGASIALKAVPPPSLAHSTRTMGCFTCRDQSKPGRCLRTGGDGRRSRLCSPLSLLSCRPPIRWRLTMTRPPWHRHHAHGTGTMDFTPPPMAPKNDQTKMKFGMLLGKGVLSTSVQKLELRNLWHVHFFFALVREAVLESN